MKLDVYSHHVVFTKFDKVAHRALYEYTKGFVDYSTLVRSNGEVVTTPLCMYSTRSQDCLTWRFHIRQLPGVLRSLQVHGIDVDAIERVDHPLYEPTYVVFVLNPDFTALDYQEPFIEYIVEPGTQKIITLQTGKGKTATTLMAAVKLAVRICIVVNAQYMSRWTDDLVGPKSVLRLDPADVREVRGSLELMELFKDAIRGTLTAKAVVISNTTLMLFYKHYEVTNGDTERYGLAPHEMWEVMGIGLRIVDEVHQKYHFNFIQDLYTHVIKSIDLSATLTSDNPLTNRMYSLQYPMEIRINAGEYDKYIYARALFYSMDQPQNIRYTNRGLSSYSHTAFEESIMKQPKRLQNYLKMISGCVEELHLKEAEPGQKLLIFASTVKMCIHIKTHLEERIDTHTVTKYTASDDKKNLHESDIIVSTLGSAGTAVDIKNLKQVHMSSAVSSTQANLQALGRLRKPKNYPEVKPGFFYYVCRDIPKQVQYHRKKLTETFRGKVTDHGSIELPYKL